VRLGYAARRAAESAKDTGVSARRPAAEHNFADAREPLESPFFPRDRLRQLDLEFRSIATGFRRPMSNRRDRVPVRSGARFGASR